MKKEITFFSEISVHSVIAQKLFITAAWGASDHIKSVFIIGARGSVVG
jgi:hypothetical protein